MPTPSLTTPLHRPRLWAWCLPTAAGVTVPGVLDPRAPDADPPPAPAPPELVILSCRPSLWFILLHRGGWLLALFALAILSARLAREAGLPILSTLPPAALLAAVVLLLWNTLDWLCRAYVLTTGRILRTSGVLVRVHREIPLRNLQSVTLVRSLRERLVGIGSLGVSSAGSAGLELSWYMVPRPQRLLETVRAAADSAGAQARPPGTLP